MSDFGTTLSITKKNGEGFLKEEVSAISAFLKNSVLSNDAFTNLIGKPYTANVNHLDDELLVIMSDYAYGEDEVANDELFHRTAKKELEDALLLAGKIEYAFPGTLVNVALTEW